MFNCIVRTLVFIVTLVPLAYAEEILVDGNMDDLIVGTNPDAGLPAGAWGFYDVFIEQNPTQMSIVQTSTFDPEEPGNSLMINVIPNNAMFLPNLFTRTIKESEGDLVHVSFDIFLPTQGLNGCTIFVGGDHGGGGWSSGSDRGPQLTWIGGDLKHNNNGFPLVPDVPFQEWQSVRLVIDLSTDTFDVFWGLRDGQLNLVGDDLDFRNSVDLDHLDRFTLGCYPGLPPCNSAIDNVNVIKKLPVVLGDVNLDGVVDLLDVQPFVDLLISGDFQAEADINQDGVVDLLDVQPFVDLLTG